MSDTPAPDKPTAGNATKISPELQSLMDQNAILAQQLSMAQNQAKLISTALPSDVKPLDGTIKTDGDHPIESQFLAYRAVGMMAAAIARDPKMPAEGTIVIYSETEVSSLLSYQSFLQQLDLLQTEMTEERERANKQLEKADDTTKDTIVEFRAAAALPIMAPLVASSALKSAIDLVALFRTDVDIKSKDLTIADQALIAPLAAALANDQRAVFHPSMLPPHLLSSASPLLTKLQELGGLRKDLQDLADQAAAMQALLKQQSDTLGEEIAAAAALRKNAADLVTETDAATVAALKQQQAETSALLADLETFTGIPSKNAASRQAAKESTNVQLGELVTRLNAAMTSYTSLLAAIVKGDDPSPLVKMLRAEKLKTAMAHSAFTLQVKIAAAGGAQQVKRNLLFSKISYSGGAVATWMLFNADGSVHGGGIARGYTGLIEVGSRPEAEGETDLAEFA